MLFSKHISKFCHFRTRMTVFIHNTYIMIYEFIMIFIKMINLEMCSKNVGEKRSKNIK